MHEIQPMKILSVSSEDYSQPAENLLKGSSSFQWCCKNSAENEACVEFQFAELFKFTRIELGNNGSAFVEIQVSKFSDINDYQVLLCSTALMTPPEALKCEGLKRIRYFKESNFSKASLDKWDIVKVICTQPFNKILQYGLSFIRFFSEANSEINIKTESVTAVEENIIDFTRFMKDDSQNSNNWRPGSLFTQRNKPESSSHSTSVRESEINMVRKIESNSEEAILNNSITNQVTSRSTIVAQSQKIFTENIAGSKAKSIHKSVSKRKHDDVDNDQSITSSAPKLQKMIDKKDAKDCEQVHSCLKDSGKPRHNNTLLIKNTVDIPVQHQYLTTDEVTKQSRNQNDGASTSTTNSSSERNILSDVVFVLSGYQNPGRNNLRDKALSLGAQYRSSWTDDCTHLICAFNNTPKFREVSGKGIIVSEKWISDCYIRKQMLPWRQYRLKGAPSPDKKVIPTISSSSAHSSGTHNVFPTTSVSSHDVQQIDIDSLIQLPTVLVGEHVFLYGSFGSGELRFLTRWIESFGGTLHRFMDPQVSVVITDVDWTSDFDEALRVNPRLRFIRSAWLHRCDETGCQVPIEEFEVHK